MSSEVALLRSFGLLPLVWHLHVQDITRFLGVALCSMYARMRAL